MFSRTFHGPELVTANPGQIRLASTPALAEFSGGRATARFYSHITRTRGPLAGWGDDSVKKRESSFRYTGSL
jgi:hypothetical protein